MHGAVMVLFGIIFWVSCERVRLVWYGGWRDANLDVVVWYL